MRQPNAKRSQAANERTRRDGPVVPALYYDYNRQAWIRDGRVAACGHPEPLTGCYACENAGESVDTGGA